MQAPGHVPFVEMCFSPDDAKLIAVSEGGRAAHFWDLAAIGRELAGRLSVTPGTLVPLLDRLEEAGYLKRVPDTEDRRLTWLELTSKGDRLFVRLFGLGARRMMTAISRLSTSDRELFKRLVNQITEHLEAG